MTGGGHINVQRDAYIRELLACCLDQSAIKADPALHQWLQYEQQGYPEGTKLPEYRMVNCRQQGLFTDSDHRHQHLEYINDNSLQTKHRCQLRYMAMPLPLNQYIEVSQVTRTLWPEKLVEFYAQELIPDMTCLQAWQVLDNPPVSRMLAGILYELRQRLQQNPELFKLLNPLIDRIGDHHPAIKPLWNSRPNQQTTNAEDRHPQPY